MRNIRSPHTVSAFINICHFNIYYVYSDLHITDLDPCQMHFDQYALLQETLYDGFRSGKSGKP